MLGLANDKTMESIKLKRHQPFTVTGTGLNLRIHPFSTLLIKHQLKTYHTQKLPRKREVASFLYSALADIPELETPHVPDNSKPAWYAFPILFNKKHFSISKQEFIKAVNENLKDNLFDAPVSTCPIHSYPIFAESKVSFKGALKYHEEVFKIPVPDDDKRMVTASKIIDSLNKIVSLYRR